MLNNTSRAQNIFGSLVLLVFAISIAMESCRLGLGEWNNPGAGYFAFGASVLLGMMALVVLVKGLLRGPAKVGPVSDSERVKWQNVVFVLAGMIVYTYLLDKIGFILGTFLLVGFLLRVIAPKRWFATILIAFFCAVCSYLLFSVLLGAELPRGVLPF